MIGTLKSIIELQEVSGCPIGFQEGQYTTATKEGSVKLIGNLKFENVLYMPRLNCNLFFVSQLIDESNCIV